MQLNDKTVSRVFKFLLSIWEVSKVNALIQQTLLSANRTVSSFRSKHVLFFNRQDLLVLPVGFFCFLFFINSTFYLGPGVIACATGVFFFLRFSGQRRQVQPANSRHISGRRFGGREATTENTSAVCRLRQVWRVCGAPFPLARFWRS